MLLHEKLRLQRKINKLTLRQLKASSRKERMTKSIARVQKMYSTRQTKLQKMAQLMQNQFKMNLYNSAGLGTQNQTFNPYGGGMTSFVYNQIGQLLGNFNGKVPDGYESDGKTVKYRDIDGSMDSAKAQAMMGEYAAGTLRANYKKDDNGASTNEIENYGEGKYTADEYKVFMQALNGAQNMQSQAQMYCQQMDSQYQNNVSIWLEAAEAQLEAEQDAVLAPLEEQETEWDMESQSCETQLADARARLDGIKQALSEGIKDSAPTFGLG